MKKGSFTERLQDDGFSNETVSARTIEVEVGVALGGELYTMSDPTSTEGQRLTLEYRAREGISGLAKTPR